MWSIMKMFEYLHVVLFVWSMCTCRMVLPYRTHWWHSHPEGNNHQQQQQQYPDGNSYQNGLSGGQYGYLPSDSRVPKDIMVDVINDMGLALLEAHNENNDNNIALSPYGATSVLVALLEGLIGEAGYEIRNALRLPPELSVIRIGLRDIHRHLKSYFIPKEGFLAGLTLSHDNITLNREYQSILKFYGYDIGSFNNAIYPDLVGTTNAMSLGTMTTTSMTTTEVPVTTTAEMTTKESISTIIDKFTSSLDGEVATSTLPSKETGVTTKLPTPDDEMVEGTTSKKLPTRSYTTEVPDSVATETIDVTDASGRTETYYSTTTFIGQGTTSMEVDSTTTGVTNEKLRTSGEEEYVVVDDEGSKSHEGDPVTKSDVFYEATTFLPISTPPGVEILDGVSTINWVPVVNPSRTTTIGTTTRVLKTKGTTRVVEDTTGEGTEASGVVSEGTSTVTEGSTSVSEGSTSIPEVTTLKTKGTTPVFEGSTSIVDGTNSLDVDITSDDVGTTSVDADTTSVDDGTTLQPQKSPRITYKATTYYATTPLQDTTTESSTETTSVEVPTTDYTLGTTIQLSPSTETTPNLEDIITFPPNNPSNPSEPNQKLTLQQTPSPSTTTTETSPYTSLEDQTLETRTNSTMYEITANISTTPKPIKYVPPKRQKRSIVDYLIARYYDDYYINDNRRYLPSPTPPPTAKPLPKTHYSNYQPEEPYTFLVNGMHRESNISFMSYDTVLPFYYIRSLKAMALSFPLDSNMYYLLLLLPIDERGIDKLIYGLRNELTLRNIVDRLEYTHVKAVIPSFMLRGYVVLTPTLQKLRIRKIFEPRNADFSQMTPEPNLYVTNIEQAVTVTIRNYADPASHPARNLNQYRAVEFKADHPFLYFVMDSQIHVNLMAGKIINPLNSRVR